MEGIPRRRRWGLRALLLFLTAPPLAAKEGSPIAKDEVVVFFPSLGREEEDGSWRTEVHGWIFEPEEGSLLRSAGLGLLRRALGVDPQGGEAELFEKRARPFLADSERSKAISIRLGGKVHALEPSGPNGHLRGTLRLSGDEAATLLTAPAALPCRLRFEAVMRRGDERTFSGEVFLLEAAGLSIVSDIDDTVKVSEVRDRKALLANTFLREFRAVPGMAEAYRAWAEAGASFHYVSASPWQLYEPLASFLRDGGFPAGSFHLKTFRWKDSSFFSLFASPEEYKKETIGKLLESYPRRRFILIGDSGEKDPEAYGALARKHPGQVERILIRDVTEEGPEAPRYQRAFAGLPPGTWSVFRDAAEVKPAAPDAAAAKAGGEEPRR
jgi:hypothetical protein